MWKLDVSILINKEVIRKEAKKWGALQTQIQVLEFKYIVK